MALIADEQLEKLLDKVNSGELKESQFSNKLKVELRTFKSKKAGKLLNKAIQSGALTEEEASGISPRVKSARQDARFEPGLTEFLGRGLNAAGEFLGTNTSPVLKGLERVKEAKSCLLYTS
ncbi:MAG TPA: hypothetical protein ENI23_06775, partial [bacterium]|nr:hypothetical protein [bacterium]